MNATFATMRGALTDAVARRASFWLQLTIMIVNDLAWVAFWALFFHRVHDVRGWDVHAIFLLYAVLTASAGLVLGLLSNSRRLAELIDVGAVDQVLTMPVRPLAQLLVRRIDPVNLGDVVFGVTLFCVAGHPTPIRAAVFVFAVTASATLLTGFLVAAGSAVFFTGKAQGGELSLHSILLLSSYPAEIFTGLTKGVLLTVVPAAFVSSVPSRLVHHFTWSTAGAMAAAAVVFAALGTSLFHAGLRRYSSGSAWSRP